MAIEPRKAFEYARCVDGWRNRLRGTAAPIHVEVDAGSEDAQAYLALRGAEASMLPTTGGYSVLFRDPRPSVSAILEEFSHILQEQGESFSDKPDHMLTLTLREIEVAECLDRHADRLEVPEAERDQTRALLASYRSSLTKWETFL